jgi:hypothetical protein
MHVELFLLGSLIFILQISGMIILLMSGLTHLQIIDKEGVENTI